MSDGKENSLIAVAAFMDEVMGSDELTAIFADGKISTTEAFQIAGMLLKTVLSIAFKILAAR